MEEEAEREGAKASLSSRATTSDGNAPAGADSTSEGEGEGDGETAPQLPPILTSSSLHPHHCSPAIATPNCPRCTHAPLSLPAALPRAQAEETLAQLAHAALVALDARDADLLQQVVSVVLTPSPGSITTVFSLRSSHLRALALFLSPLPPFPLSNPIQPLCVPLLSLPHLF